MTRVNYIAGAAVVAMMLLTCADIVMRFFGKPLPGVYDLVGFLGAVSVSFALAYTSVQRGHVAVEIVMERLPQRIQFRLQCIGNLGGAVFFLFLMWQSFLYARELFDSGEVSMTVAMPIHPFVFGMSAGCGLLSIVLIMDGLLFLRRGFAK
ncbi:MAG: TRAP transporter small permease [Syntrophaceae bacterium]|nr:TRAP transporter small permease [Syntrophaceae bacterium]